MLIVCLLQPQEEPEEGAQDPDGLRHVSPRCVCIYSYMHAACICMYMCVHEVVCSGCVGVGGCVNYMHMYESLPCPPLPEIGYTQGMNDLLARFLVVTDSEVDSYWMFVRYMELKRPDFLEHSMMKKVGEQRV